MKIVIAGRVKPIKINVVIGYITDRKQTASEFDLRTGTFSVVDERLIKATRIINSRISNRESNWFISRSESAPWEKLGPKMTLLQADPMNRGGLYDDALSLWNHFDTDAPTGIADGKISKVLHAMRPNFFPILDSKIRERYRSYAKECAAALSETRPMRYAYWSAIRNDLIASSAGLLQLRAKLQMHESDAARRWEAQVSDVRLHDVVAWS